MFDELGEGGAAAEDGGGAAKAEGEGGNEGGLLPVPMAWHTKLARRMLLMEPRLYGWGRGIGETPTAGGKAIP